MWIALPRRYRCRCRYRCRGTDEAPRHRGIAPRGARGAWARGGGAVDCTGTGAGTVVPVPIRYTARRYGYGTEVPMRHGGTDTALWYRYREGEGGREEERERRGGREGGGEGADTHGPKRGGGSSERASERERQRPGPPSAPPPPPPPPTPLPPPPPAGPPRKAAAGPRSTRPPCTSPAHTPRTPVHLAHNDHINV